LIDVIEERDWNMKECVREQYVRLYAQDVRAFPDCYKERIVNDPEGAARQTIEVLDDDEVRQCIRDLKEEQRDLAKHGYHLPESA